MHDQEAFKLSWIYFDLDENMNLVEFWKEESRYYPDYNTDHSIKQQEHEKRLHRIPMIIPSQSQVEPPAPHLVGIEVNPGPSDVTSSPASHLFSDGIASIFVFLSTSDFVAAASVSQYWFKCASTIPPSRLSLAMDDFARTLSLYHSSTANPVVPHYPTFFERLLKALSCGASEDEGNASLKEVKSVMPMISPWSLRHLIEEYFSETAIPWNAITEQMRYYPHLQSLGLRIGNVRNEVPPISEISLPSTLTFLSIKPDWANVSEPYMQLLLNNIGRYTSLTELEFCHAHFLNRSNESLDLFQLPPSIDFSPLLYLSQLQMLVMCVALTGGNHVTTRERLCRTIAQLSSLHLLTLEIRHDSSVRGQLTLHDATHLSHLRKLTRFRVIDTEMNAHTWCVLLALPSLVTIESSWRDPYTTDIIFQVDQHGIELFGANRKSDLGDYWHSDANEMQVIDTLNKIASRYPFGSTITELCVTDWQFQESQWISISTALPGLIKLRIQSKCSYDAFLTLVTSLRQEVRDFRCQLRSLYLVNNDFKLDLAFFSHLAQFTSLLHLEIWHRAEAQFRLKQECEIRHRFKQLLNDVPTLLTIHFQAQDKHYETWLKVTYSREQEVRMEGLEVKADTSRQVQNHEEEQTILVSSSFSSSPARHLVGIELNPGHQM